MFAARQALECGQTQYTAVDGTAELKEGVRARFQRENGVTFGAGCKQVLYNAFAATLHPGDEVLIQSPCWGCYAT